MITAVRLVGITAALLISIYYLFHLIIRSIF